jgi:AcrR family transcriptional regulator
MLDQMHDMRRRGFTMPDIAARTGVSERTVRRYVRGVEPKLERPEPEKLDLTRWCIERSQVLRRIAKITVLDMDHVIRTIHAQLAKLDPETRKWLEADEEARFEFLHKIVWRRAARAIGNQRSIDRFREQFGGMGIEFQEEDDPPDEG